MTKIKICGVTRAEDAVFAAGLGADFIGMVFVPSSPRYVTPSAAAAIVERARAPHVKFVGVFRDAPIDTIRETVRVVGLDYVQFHGSEPEAHIDAANAPVIRAFHVAGVLPDTSATANAEWFLFDTFDARVGGGTGRPFDWSLLAGWPRTKPFLLAGGITPDNAVQAIRTVSPSAIDVASGVESAAGIKDHRKLANLFERVRTTT